MFKSLFCLYLVAWVKWNVDPVCFGTRDDSYGVFNVTQGGYIGALKLVHLYGFLRCYPGSPISYWGCISSHYGDKTLMTFISHPDERSILLPRPNTTQMGGPWGGCDNDFTYKLYRFNDVSPEIIFNTTSDPLQVSLNQQFWIWFGQDFADCSEGNNRGESCVDVFGWYIAWTTITSLPNVIATPKEKLRRMFAPHRIPNYRWSWPPDKGGRGEGRSQFRLKVRWRGRSISPEIATIQYRMKTHATRYVKAPL